MKNFLLLLAVFICACKANLPLRQTDRERDGFFGKAANVYYKVIYSGGKRCAKRADSYNSEGKLTQHTLYIVVCSADKITADYEYTSDDKRKTMTNGKLGGTTVFVYDTAGKLETETSVLNEKPDEQVQVRYRYDEKGRIYEKFYSTNGVEYGKEIYEYKGDEKFPAKFTFNNTKDNNSYTITYGGYELNSEGDWIKRTESDGKTTTYIERSIEYFTD